MTRLMAYCLQIILRLTLPKVTLCPDHPYPKIRRSCIPLLGCIIPNQMKTISQYPILHRMTT